jgi:hypothetical protein
VMHEGGLVLAQNRNRSHRGSVLANAMQGASISDRGNLYGVGAGQLWGIWVVIRLVSSGGAWAEFTHLLSPVLFIFLSHSLSPPQKTL